MKSCFVITGYLAVGLAMCNQAQAQIFGPGQPIPERHSFPLCTAASDVGCYDRPDFSISESATKLGEDTFAYWVSGSDLRVVARGDKPQLCCTFSDAKYPLYIIHYPFIYTFAHWKWGRNPSPGVSLGVEVALYFGIIALAWLCLKFYDEPMRAALTRWLTPSTGKSGPASKV